MSAQKILKTENIIKIYPDELLESALKKLSSSHDAAFVFDEKDNFLGVINPYYCVIKSSFPANTKVINCLFHPQKLKMSDTLVKVAEALINSKVHYLPIVDERDKFIGIISARRLLKFFLEDERFKIKINEVLKLKKRPLSIVKEDDSVAFVLKNFQKTHYSKLVVVDRDFKLKGLLSYFDLIYYLMMPKHKAHMGERNGVKINFYRQQVKNFMKTYVLTLTENDPLTKAIDLILDKKIGSVVIINEEKKPKQIVTTRDILSFFVKKEKEKLRFLPQFLKIRPFA